MTELCAASQPHKVRVLTKIDSVMTEQIIHIDALEVARKFGYLIAGRGKFSGLEFAKRILSCDKDCKEHRETCASSVASSVYEIQICGVSGCRVIELI